jgi:RHS repeat-associated protein
MELDRYRRQPVGYDSAGPDSGLVSDACTSGDFSGITISNHFNALYGRDFVQAQISGQSTMEDDYGYDTYGRMNSAAYGAYSAAYAYLPDTDRLQTTTCKSNSLAILTTTRVWQGGMRLQSIANVVNGTVVSGHNYLYDQAHRRTQATLEDGSIWKYAYNDRDELISGKRYWADWAPVAGQQFEYAYDNIGNRTGSKSGGDTGGSNLRTTSYGPNALNQYTNVTTPGYKDIIGAAMATNSVAVNGNATDRKVEYFHNELSIANGSGPVYQSVSISSGSSNVTGNVLFPPNQQTLAYDDDGNLLSDGLWAYTWDSENRLIQMVSASAVTNSAKRKLVFSYDGQGRRTRKQVFLWGTSDWNSAPTLDQRFVYDGWNLLAELNATNNAPIRSYLWGLDLSGTTTGAGGVGGLVGTWDYATGAYHFAYCGANGEVTGLINSSERTVSRSYEYSPFGELMRANGPLPSDNPFRFSTRWYETESELAFFGGRYYWPRVGRWINRDPAEQRGGLSLYSYVANHPTTSIDPDGRAEHHVATMQLANSLPDGPGTDYLKQFTIPVQDPHYYDLEHRAYNPAVREFFDKWLAKNGITEAEFARSASFAEKFVGDVMAQPASSKIGSFLSKASAVGAKALKAAVVLGSAFGAGAAVYSTYAGGKELVQAANEYKHDVISGADSGMIDLDAVDVAVAVQTMTGDYFVTANVLDTLLQ